MLAQREHSIPKVLSTLAFTSILAGIFSLPLASSVYADNLDSLNLSSQNNTQNTSAFLYSSSINDSSYLVAQVETSNQTSSCSSPQLNPLHSSLAANDTHTQHMSNNPAVTQTLQTLEASLSQQSTYPSKSQLTSAIQSEDPSALKLRELFEHYTKLEQSQKPTTKAVESNNSSNQSATDEVALSQLFKKYQELSTQKPTTPKLDLSTFQTDVAGWPGMIYGNEQGEGESSFNFAWPYRHIAFEMHIQDQKQLSAMIYSLAVHAKDISADTPRDKFYKGVSGFHYSIEQICAWLNDPNKIELNAEERGFVQQLENHGVIKKEANQYISASSIKHVLAASASKKRSFERNLRHERLHIFYDEDQDFRDSCLKRFKALDIAEQKEILKKYSHYNQENLPQLIEEWAVSIQDQTSLPHV